MTYEYTLPLADASAVLDNVGGKGASLARLANAGLPVPGGFHVTTDAYKRFVATNNLQPAILEALTAVDPAQPATLETASRTIADLFARAPMPREIADAIALAFADLPGEQPVVAVRSSAPADRLAAAQPQSDVRAREPGRAPAQPGLAAFRHVGPPPGQRGER